ncbi:MAG: hypothetical protein GY940_47560 [bacterium]|nr:hypothetical protein [bacterium]
MKSIRHFQPLFFALFSLILYMLLYRPPLDPGSQDFVTALMTFFAALGWSGIIRFTQEKHPALLFTYLFISIGSPIVLYLFFEGFSVPLHIVTFGLFLLALIGLRFFVAAHIRHEMKKQGETHE